MSNLKQSLLVNSKQSRIHGVVSGFRVIWECIGDRKRYVQGYVGVALKWNASLPVGFR